MLVDIVQLVAVLAILAGVALTFPLGVAVLLDGMIVLTVALAVERAL